MKNDEIRIESTSFQSYTHLQKNINLFLLQKKHSRTNLNSLTTTVYQCLCEYYKHITKTRRMVQLGQQYTECSIQTKLQTNANAIKKTNQFPFISRG